MLNKIESFLHSSPVNELELFPGKQIHVKRDDLIHPEISGNKWRKLKYNLLKARETGCDTLLTFGGAFSNHLAAVAKAGELEGLKTIAIVRGTHVELNNPTLSFAASCGMKLIPVPLEEYDQRNNYNYHDQLKLEFPSAHIVPEGGANAEGVSGCMEIIKELEKSYDFIFCTLGTGTTAAGLILAKPPATKIMGVNVFKSDEGIREMVNAKINLILNSPDTLKEYQQDFEVVNGYGFGGYAKADQSLKDFTREVYKEHHLPLDLVYTAKAFFAMKDYLSRCLSDPFPRVLFYHSGGLQGNQGFGFEL